MIDLHLHTTASDGLLTPAALVARAASAGLDVISVTDHDTAAGLDEAAAAARRHEVRLVTGIEVTAVEGGRDVHILGYFLDPASLPLAAFLGAQRADRVRRVREMSERLRSLGCGIDEESILARAAGTARSVGRPAVADALVAAGHAADRDDAFRRWLAHGRPAFVPRRGASADEVVGVIHEAGGIASLAHPGVLAEDDLIPRLAAGGLDALEVWHSDHDVRQCEHYAALSRRFGLAMSGGSDFHGDGVHRANQLGAVALPPGEFARLEATARLRQDAAPRGTARANGGGPAG